MTARAERIFVVSLGQRVRFLRRVRRLTTRELAVRVPSVVVLMRLAAELQVLWVALVEPAQEDAERMLREAWSTYGLASLPPGWPGVDQAEGLPSQLPSS